MRITVVGRDKKSTQKLKQRIRKDGYTVVSSDPDFVISLGGDGTLLIAERIFPGIPKVPIRDKSICKRCFEGHLHELLAHLQKNKSYDLKKYTKLEAVIQSGIKKEARIALNDVVIRNRDPQTALRFLVQIKGRKERLAIGDGVVVATPFGSTGYFQSITGTSFNTGLGVAFNNLTEPNKPILASNITIRVKIIRNPAVLVSDNEKKTILLKEGDIITIRKSKQQACIVGISDDKFKFTGPGVGGVGPEHDAAEEADAYAQ